MGQVLFEITIIFILLIGNGVLAMAEMSLVSARKARLSALAENGSRAARQALDLAAAPNQLLSTVQIGITMVGILAGAFGGATVAKWLGEQFIVLGLPIAYAEKVGLVLVVLAITFFSLILGELVPKRLALSSPERFACLLAGPMRFLSVLARPAVALLGWTTDGILRAIGARQEAHSQVTDDEIRMLMREGTSAGVFHKAESKMVERVMELDEVQVREIMTPRPKVMFLSVTETHDHLWPKITKSWHSHFPVYENVRDNVVGVVSVKAIYANLAAGAPVNLSDLMLPPYFVPGTLPVVQLLDAFRSSGRHFALVADEFGGVSGVVTLVDVLESIVGDVPGREERSRPSVRTREDGGWIIDGTVAVSEIEEQIPGIVFAPEDERSYQTVAGFVLDILGHIPHEGEAFVHHGFRYEVIDMDRQRIDKIHVRRCDTAAVPVQP